MQCPYCGMKIEYGTIIIKYIDDTGIEIADADMYNNLMFGTYIFTSKDLKNINYHIMNNSDLSKKATLTESQPLVTLTFIYTKSK